jgi:site-specific recombinase XerD
MTIASPTTPIVPVGDLAANVASFRRHIRAANLSQRTQRSYLDAIDILGRYLAEHAMPTDVAGIKREHVEAFIEDQLARLSAGSAANRYASLRPFFNWLVAEGEIKESPMARMRKPKQPEYVPAMLADTEITAILKACDGPSFDDRRDAALVRVFASSGARLSEVEGMRWTPDNADTNDVDLDGGLIRVMGKGRRERLVYVGPKAVKALDRYLRRRDQRSDAALPWLWLGQKGKLGSSGIAQVMRRRGRAAGVDRLHPHLFRHTFAHVALSAGMQEGEVMVLAGWRSREMLSRYAKSAAGDRAVASAKRLSIGDRY